MMYILENAWQGYNVRDTETNKTLNFQFDTDFPGLAENFGARVICECGETDGTVDCPHKTAFDMIQGAINWLDENEGAEVESGYEDHSADSWHD